MKSTKLLPWGIASVCFLLVIILLFRRCAPSDGSTTTIFIRDTVPGDPYPVSVPVYIPKVAYLDTGQTIYLPGEQAPADTMAILQDYFATRYYLDTLKNDTSILAVLEDSVRANRIVSRRFTYQNRRPTAINTTMILPPRKEPAFRLYAGVFAGFSPKTQRFGVGPELTVTIRQGLLLGYGYDVPGNGHLLRGSWKISFKKSSK